MILDRNSDIMGTIEFLIRDMKEQGMDVYYRDWGGIIQGYSPVYHSQVGLKCSNFLTKTYQNPDSINVNVHVTLN